MKEQYIDVMELGNGKKEVCFIGKKDCRVYNVMSDKSIKEKSIIMFIVKILRGIADFLLGIKNRYPLCCIKTYIANQERYYIKGIERILCKKCYIKIIKTKEI